ncbi:MAG: ribonuclease P protein component [Armatimonadota bacterium]|nr:ribonuclease P protein component [Armatimonadota bacterium]
MASARPLGRLAKEHDFRRVYREGFRCSTALLVLYARPDQHRGVRLGLAVGRRLGHAVARNRLRRRLREAVREICGQVRFGVDLVIVPRASAGAAVPASLRAAIRQALEAAGLLGDGPEDE